VAKLLDAWAVQATSICGVTNALYYLPALGMGTLDAGLFLTVKRAPLVVGGNSTVSDCTGRAVFAIVFEVVCPGLRFAVWHLLLLLVYRELAF